MSEGKYVEEVYRRVCKMGDCSNALADVLRIANEVAHEHPLQYERFRIWATFVRSWRWVISKTCDAISRRSDGKGAS